MCRSKEYGVLGIGNLVFKNIALIDKWLWRFHLEPHYHWHEVIRSKFGVQRDGWDVDISISVTYASPWKFIHHYFHFIRPYFRYVVGNGNKI